MSSFRSMDFAHLFLKAFSHSYYVFQVRNSWYIRTMRFSFVDVRSRHICHFGYDHELHKIFGRLRKYAHIMRLVYILNLVLPKLYAVVRDYCEINIILFWLPTIVTRIYGVKMVKLTHETPSKRMGW